MVKKNFLDDFKQFLDAFIRTDDGQKTFSILIKIFTNLTKFWILLVIIFKWILKITSLPKLYLKLHPCAN